MLGYSKSIAIPTTFVSMILIISLSYTNAYPTSEKETLQNIQDSSSLDNPPEDRVIINSYRLTTSEETGETTFNINGEIQNNRDETIEFVEVIATFYDSNKAVLGSDFTFSDPDTLRPGQAAPFEISLWPGVNTDIPISEIASIKMHIDWSR
jgi:hypothetical protein